MQSKENLLQVLLFFEIFAPTIMRRNLTLFMEESIMTNEEKKWIWEHNVMMELDRLEDSLRHNIGKERTTEFIVPLREFVQEKIDTLK